MTINELYQVGNEFLKLSAVYELEKTFMKEFHRFFKIINFEISGER